MAAKTEGRFVAEFIEGHCCLTRGERAGQPVRLEPFQRELLDDLFELRGGKRRNRRAYIQMPRKNGKTFLMACVSLYEALTGEIGGEVYFVAGDRQQASRAFDECRRIVEQDPELASLFKAVPLLDGGASTDDPPRPVLRGRTAAKASQRASSANPQGSARTAGT